MWALRYRPSWIAGVLFVAFLLCLSTYAELILQGRVRLIVDSNGIFNPKWQIGTIAWTDVNDIFVRVDGGEEALCVTLSNRIQLRGQLGRFGRTWRERMYSAGYGDFSVNVTQLGIRADGILDYAAKQMAAVR